MPQKKEPEASDDVHSAKTLEVSAAEVQKLVARSALTSHDFNTVRTVAGFFKCNRCPQLVREITPATLLEDCANAPAFTRAK